VDFPGVILANSLRWHVARSSFGEGGYPIAELETCRAYRHFEDRLQIRFRHAS
jgi:hypothetical protein